MNNDTLYPRAVAVLRELAADGDSDAYAPEQYGSLFTMGGCALYATALAWANPGWTVVGAGEPACVEYDDTEPDLCPCGDYGDGVCGCMIGHFYAASPDGWLHDVYGRHDPTGVLENKALHPVGDLTLACVLETWHYGLGEDYDTAALAVVLTAV